MDNSYHSFKTLDQTTESTGLKVGVPIDSAGVDASLCSLMLSGARDTSKSWAILFAWDPPALGNFKSAASNLVQW